MGEQFVGVPGQALDPAQLVVEFWSRCRIAIGQIEAADQDTVYGRLDVAAMGVVIVSRKAAPGLDRLGTACEDSDTVPTLLTVPDSTVAGVPDSGLREVALWRF